MVNKNISRKRVICPNGHEVITRKSTGIQCRKCSLQGKGKRFAIKAKTDPILAEVSKNMFVLNHKDKS